MEPQSTPQKFQNLLKTLLIALGAVVGLVAVSLFGLALIANQQGIVQPDPIEDEGFVTAQIINSTNNQFTFSLEVADTVTKWSRGLMNRTALPDNTGMLFIFPDSQPRTFWMKNTLISLDIIFIDEQYKIINIHKSTKPNQTQETYSSTSSVKYVVELPAGTAEKLNLLPGDLLRLVNR